MDPIKDTVQKIVKDDLKKAKDVPTPVLEDKVSLLEKFLSLLNKGKEGFFGNAKQLLEAAKKLAQVPADAVKDVASPEKKKHLLARLKQLYSKIIALLKKLYRKIPRWAKVVGIVLLTLLSYLSYSRQKASKEALKKAMQNIPEEDIRELRILLLEAA